MLKLFSFCSVVGFLDYGAQATLENVRRPLPKDIRSDNRDFEKQQKLAKLVIEQYTAYRGNYSGNIIFDIEDGSKNTFKKANVAILKRFSGSFKIIEIFLLI